MVALIFPHASTAQLVWANAFLQGNSHEVGVSPCGSIGAEAPPSFEGPLGSFHDNSHYTPYVSLGMVADSDEDGWLVGLPRLCGDYIFSAAHIEEWAVTCSNGAGVEPNLSVNAGFPCGTMGIPGSIIGYTDDGTYRAALWSGSVSWSPTQQISLTQTVTIPLADQIVLFEIVLCNTGSETITDFYYGRNIDPDNEAIATDYHETQNTIAKQPPADQGALVEARGLLYGCYLGLGAVDSRARASYGRFYIGNPFDMWHGLGGYSLAGSDTADVAISISFKVDSIPPGAFDTLRFAYVLDEDDLSKAIVAMQTEGISFPLCDATTPPSGQSHVSFPSRVELEWFPPAGSIGCQIQVQQVPSGPKYKLDILSFPYNKAEVPHSILGPGTNWVWRVKCRCSSSPVVVSPTTPYGDLFSVPALREGQLAESRLSVYPNPAQTSVVLEWEPDQSGLEILQVSNLLGQVVVQQELPSLEGANRFELNVSGFTEGLYFIRLGQRESQTIQIR